MISPHSTRDSFARFGDPEIQTRITQYEMAFRMQTAAPEIVDLSDEPESTFKLYGEDARRPGTYAYNCLLARRLAERDVRFVQLFHRGWDQHGSLVPHLTAQCKDTDQASAALVTDLEQRGLLEDTLSDLGRRVRAHQLQPGGAGQRPRPPRPLLLDLDGWRRHQTRRRPRRNR